MWRMWLQISHCYDENELRQLTLVALFYALKHTDGKGRYEIILSDEIPGLLSAKIQSRDILAKQYRCWVGFGDGVVDGWFCK